MLQFFFFFVFIIFAFPIVPSIWGILINFFPWSSSLDFLTLKSSPLITILNSPGVLHSILLSLFTGTLSTLFSIFFCYKILQFFWLTNRWKFIEYNLLLFLAIPHAAFALGLVLTFSTTGFIARLLSFSDILSNLSLNIINDPLGIGLILTLILKETPFLLLMSIGVLQQIRVKSLLSIGRTLGYNSKEAWLKIIMPLWLPKMRLPIFAVAAYGISVVDVALIIGPTKPPTLAVKIWQWFNQPSVEFFERVTQGSLLLIFIVAGILGLIRIFEWLFLKYSRSWQVSGPSGNLSHETSSKILVSSGIYLSCAIPIMVTGILLFWSFTERWRFPEILPTAYTFRFWKQETFSLIELSGNSLLIAVFSSLISLVFVIIVLEFRDKSQKTIPNWILVFPLVVPQLSLLFGVQMLIHYVNPSWFLFWVIWLHLFFVFPYTFLSLDGTFKGYDRRLDKIGQSLGLSGWKTWWKIKLPNIFNAIFITFAVGCSVSLAQYLPTQMMGGGRISTITTEAVTLASGHDRRLGGLYGILQGVFPLIFFILSLWVGKFCWRRDSRPNKGLRRIKS